MEKLQHNTNVTAIFLQDFLDDFDVEIKGERSFKKRLPVGTLFVQKWRDTEDWCVSLYGEDDRQMQAFVKTKAEFWLCLQVFRVKHFLIKDGDQRN